MTQKLIGDNINITPAARVSGEIIITSAATIKIADAIQRKKRRTTLIVYNNSYAPFWIKLQAANITINEEWFPLFAFGIYEMPSGEIYSGEVSARAFNNTAKAIVTDY